MRVPKLFHKLIIYIAPFALVIGCASRPEPFPKPADPDTDPSNTNTYWRGGGRRMVFELRPYQKRLVFTDNGKKEVGFTKILSMRAIQQGEYKFITEENGVIRYSGPGGDINFSHVNPEGDVFLMPEGYMIMKLFQAPLIVDMSKSPIRRAEPQQAGQEAQKPAEQKNS